MQRQRQQARVLPKSHARHVAHGFANDALVDPPQAPRLLGQQNVAARQEGEGPRHVEAFRHGLQREAFDKGLARAGLLDGLRCAQLLGGQGHQDPLHERGHVLDFLVAHDAPERGHFGAGQALGDDARALLAGSRVPEAPGEQVGRTRPAEHDAVAGFAVLA